MRKLGHLFVLLVSIFLLDTASAGNSCELVECSHGAGMESGYANREMLTPDGRTGAGLDGAHYRGRCFVCNNSNAGTKSCDDNDKVAIIELNNIVSVYRCDKGTLYDSWEGYDYSEYASVCGDSPLKRDIGGVVISYRKGDSQSGTAGIPASELLTNSQRINNLCKYIECPANKAAGPDRESCVEINRNCPLLSGGYASTGRVIANNRCNPSNLSTGLESMEHVRAGNVCKVMCVSGGWNVVLQDNSCEAGWVVAESKKKCVEDPAVVRRRENERRERDRLANATKQEKCQATGGTWANNKCTCPADKNLKKDGDECICLDDNYRRSDDGKSCVLTDEASLRRQCEAAASTGAYYQDGRCLCQDRDKIWRGNGCVENTDIARCRTATRTKWDYNAQECVCLDANYEYDSGNNECVETEEGRTRREAEEKKQRQEAEQAAAKGRITSIMGNLSSLQSGLSKSVWKNKEGNFNTSRLVSDSVAGVVLGTAGGLITSNVIKKNQVKGGFEDIQCTVRGQVVAGYGDEFQVGIQ